MMSKNGIAIRNYCNSHKDNKSYIKSFLRLLIMMSLVRAQLEEPRLYHKFDTRRNRSFTAVFAYLELKFQPTFSKF